MQLKRPGKVFILIIWRYSPIAYHCQASHHGSDHRNLRTIHFIILCCNSFIGRVDRASATEMVGSGSIPGRVPPKTIKIGIYCLPASRSAIKGTV